MRRVRSEDGTALAVAESGDRNAPTVVCVHGYPDNRTLWDPVAELLSERFHVVSYDVRGAGESDKPRDRQAYHVDRLTEDFAAVLDAVSPDGPVHVLAHDWGAIQLWHAVTDERLRGRVKSFTSVSGPCLDHAGFWLRSQRTPRGVRDLLDQVSHSFYLGLFQLPTLPELAWRSGLAGRMMRRLDATAAKPETSDAVNGLELYRANIGSRLLRPQRRRTDIPVQVIAPQRDAFVRTALQTDVAEWAPDLRVRKVPGGHWLPRQKPRVVARCAAELIDFVEGGEETRALRRARIISPDGRFAGDLAVVTGAGSGIGRATALAFAGHGADLVLTDIDKDSLEDTAARAREHGVEVDACVVDVSDADAMAELARRAGAPDIVVNNAGIGISGAFVDTTAEDWKRVVDVNLWGVIHGCRVFAERMIEHGEGGQIVNIASAAAYLPSKMMPAYATTKSAVLMLSECLRAELAAEGIGVTAICPGIVHTNITSTTRFVGTDADEQQRIQQATTAAYRRRNYPPEKVAKQILRAVERNTAVAPVTPEAKAGLLLSRLTPGLLRNAARLDLTPH